MIETSRPCLDIGQQLYAVEKAIAQANNAFIQDHLDHCLEEMVGPLDRDRRGSIDGFKGVWPIAMPSGGSGIHPIFPCCCSSWPISIVAAWSSSDRDRDDPTILQRQDTVCAVEDPVVMRHEHGRGAPLGSEALEQIDNIGGAVLVEQRWRCGPARPRPRPSSG
jgi:hypothetical protein